MSLACLVKSPDAHFARFQTFKAISVGLPYLRAMFKLLEALLDAGTPSFWLRAKSCDLCESVYHAWTASIHRSEVCLRRSLLNPALEGTWSMGEASDFTERHAMSGGKQIAGSQSRKTAPA